MDQKCCADGNVDSSLRIRIQSKLDRCDCYCFSASMVLLEYDRLQYQVVLAVVEVAENASADITEQ